jgi:AraC-like DNA-binding protein
MLPHLSSAFASSFANHSIYAPTSLPDVAIQSLITSESTRPTIHVQMRKCEFRYFDSLNAQADGHSVASIPRTTPMTADQLSRVLRTAGIDIRKLDRSADNAVGLPAVARLVETLEPSQSQMKKGRAGAALPKWRLMGLLKYIVVNIGEPITLANLVGTAGLSRICFAKQFRAATGIRPHDYVLRKRIDRDRRMLAKPAALVEIALSVGFQTQAHFTTLLKQFVGNAPYLWRREHPNVA